MTNQGDRQKKARAVAGTNLTYDGDTLAMLRSVSGVTADEPNGAWIQFVRAKFGGGPSDVSGAKNFLARNIGFDRFTDINNLDSLFYDGTTGNTNPNDSGASAISTILVPGANVTEATKKDATEALRVRGRGPQGRAFLMLDVGDPVVGQEYIFL